MEYFQKHKKKDLKEIIHLYIFLQTDNEETKEIQIITHKSALYKEYEASMKIEKVLGVVQKNNITLIGCNLFLHGVNVFYREH